VFSCSAFALNNIQIRSIAVETAARFEKEVNKTIKPRENEVFIFLIL